MLQVICAANTSNRDNTARIRGYEITFITKAKLTTFFFIFIFKLACVPSKFLNLTCFLSELACNSTSRHIWTHCALTEAKRNSAGQNHKFSLSPNVHKRHAQLSTPHHASHSAQQPKKKPQTASTFNQVAIAGHPVPHPQIPQVKVTMSNASLFLSTSKKKPCLHTSDMR